MSAMLGGMTDAQLMALEMFKDDLPCIMSMIPEVSCEQKATWLIEIEHRSGPDCGELKPNPAPVCKEHKGMMIQSMNPFWATYTGMPAPTCNCGGEIGVKSVTPV